MINSLSGSPLPKDVIQTYEKMRKVYEKLENASDERVQMEAILEVDDIEFVEHNLEHLVSNNLKNRDLWRTYLEYLSEHDIPVGWGESGNKTSGNGISCQENPGRARKLKILKRQ